MESQLWNAIESFDFEVPVSEYGFTVRLAFENAWTEDFAKKALLEYRRFMYLAAISDGMVSPSEIVDTVWHQHLIFTQLYTDFCEVLGKKIEHVPSTHSRQDFEKFKTAKEHTSQLYTATFGKQPEAIWKYSNMYESLELEKARFNIRTFLLFGIGTFLLLVYPAFLLLTSIYTQINNPDFINGYLIIAGASLIALESYNRFHLHSFIKKTDKDSFLFRLSPTELVYAKHQDLIHVAHAVVNKMVREEQVFITDTKKIKSKDYNHFSDVREFSIMQILKEYQSIYYPALLKRLRAMPSFRQIAVAMDAFKKYTIKSKFFGKLFYINFTLLALLFLFGLVRLLTGLSREKPVTLLAVVLGVFLIGIVFYLFRLLSLLFTVIIPHYYKSNIIPTLSKFDAYPYNYFLFGTAVIAADFLPMVNHMGSQNGIFSSGDGGNSNCSSCGSGCGSSCGSSCGGCGGD